MRRARLLAGVAALAAVGCLWLFPIEKKEEPLSSNSGTGVGGSSDMAGSAGSAGVPENDAGGECTVNGDCGQDFYVCHAHTCVSLKSPECILVRGNWNDPNAFIFGAYATEPAAAPEKSQPVYNYELAITELNAVGGLPDSSGTTRHPLAAVICNNDPKQAALDPEFYNRSLHHLVDELGVAAIVADLGPDQLKKAVESTKDVFFLSPGAPNNELFDLKDNGLLWSMLGPPKDLADGYADLVRRIEKYVRARGDAGTTQLRVAVVTKTDPSEVDHQLLTELHQAVLPKLSFNNDSAMNQMDGNYREFPIGAGGDAGATAVGDAINTFAPHIVISMTGTDFTSNGPGKPEGVAHRIITFVTGAGNVDPEPWKQHEYPFFIFSPINAAATNDFNLMLQSSTALGARVIYQRFLGINIAGADDRDVYGEYQKRLRAYQKDAVVDGFENYYDAIYYLAYAAYAAYTAGVEQLDGPRISSGMSRLSNGAPQKVGPIEIMPDGGVISLIEGVFQEIKTHGSALLIGAGGSQFDVAHGVRLDKAGLYCFEYNNGSVPISHQPAEIFDAQLQTWTVIAQAKCASGL